MYTVNDFEDGGNASWARPAFARAYLGKVLCYVQRGVMNRRLTVKNGVIVQDYYENPRTGHLGKNTLNSCVGMMVWGMKLTQKGYKICTRMTTEEWEAMNNG